MHFSLESCDMSLSIDMNFISFPYIPGDLEN